MTDETALEAAGGLDGGTLEGLFALSVRLYSHQLFEHSARIMEFLLRHDPARPHYHRALGKALHALQRHEQAVQSYARAVRLGLPDADVHFYIGQCLIFLRRYELAEQALERCLQLAGQQPKVPVSLIERATELVARVRALRRRASERQLAPTDIRETT